MSETVTPGRYRASISLSQLDSDGATVGVLWVLHPDSYDLALATLTKWLGPPRVSGMGTAESNRAAHEARVASAGFVVVDHDGD